MHENVSPSSRGLYRSWGGTIHNVPDRKPSMGDSTPRLVSLVAVVSERQGESHFSLNQKPISQPD